MTKPEKGARSARAHSAATAELRRRLQLMDPADAEALLDALEHAREQGWSLERLLEEARAERGKRRR